MKEGVVRWQPGWLKLLLQVGVSCGVMAGAILYATGMPELWGAWAAYERAWRLLWLILGGGMLYFSTLFLLGLRLDHLGGLRRR